MVFFGVTKPTFGVPSTISPNVAPVESFNAFRRPEPDQDDSDDEIEVVRTGSLPNQESAPIKPLQPAVKVDSYPMFLESSLNTVQSASTPSFPFGDLLKTRPFGQPIPGKNTMIGSTTLRSSTVGSTRALGTGVADKVGHNYDSVTLFHSNVCSAMGSKISEPTQLNFPAVSAPTSAIAQESLLEKLNDKDQSILSEEVAGKRHPAIDLQNTSADDGTSTGNKLPARLASSNPILGKRRGEDAGGSDSPPLDVSVDLPKKKWRKVLRNARPVGQLNGLHRPLVQTTDDQEANEPAPDSSQAKSVRRLTCKTEKSKRALVEVLAGKDTGTIQRLLSDQSCLMTLPDGSQVSYLWYGALRFIDQLQETDTVIPVFGQDWRQTCLASLCEIILSDRSFKRGNGPQARAEGLYLRYVDHLQSQKAKATNGLHNVAQQTPLSAASNGTPTAEPSLKAQAKQRKAGNEIYDREKEDYSESVVACARLDESVGRPRQAVRSNTAVSHLVSGWDTPGSRIQEVPVLPRLYADNKVVECNDQFAGMRSIREVPNVPETNPKFGRSPLSHTKNHFIHPSREGNFTKSRETGVEKLPRLEVSDPVGGTEESFVGAVGNSQPERSAQGDCDTPPQRPADSYWMPDEDVGQCIIKRESSDTRPSIISNLQRTSPTRQIVLHDTTKDAAHLDAAIAELQAQIMKGMHKHVDWEDTRAALWETEMSVRRINKALELAKDAFAALGEAKGD